MPCNACYVFCEVHANEFSVASWPYLEYIILILALCSCDVKLGINECSYRPVSQINSVLCALSHIVGDCD